VLGLLDLVAPGVQAAAAEPPYLLFVGRLIPDKRATMIPRALAAARAEMPELSAVMVGDGPERSALERAVEASGEGSRVRILGRVPDAELRDLRAGASVFVAPSVREGFGLAVAEAAASGIPSVVVAHEDNAAVELIVEGVNGFVVVPDDPGALAAGILKAVRGGPRLRSSTADWFARARGDHGLSASLDEMLGGPPVS
jgi:glycosyltransferase involved in cell wall biosynthesis